VDFVHVLVTSLAVIVTATTTENKRNLQRLGVHAGENVSTEKLKPLKHANTTHATNYTPTLQLEMHR